MFRLLRPYFIALILTWLGLIVAADVYSHRFPAYSHWIMAAVLPAFLLEAAFFIAAGFEKTRELFARISPPVVQSAFLWVSALVPYLIVTIGAGTLDVHTLGLFAGITALMSFWWVIFPHRTAFDIAFLIMAAAVIVSGFFSRLYVSPLPRLDVSYLGHVMWIRNTLLVLFVQRRFDVGPVSFWPRWSEWREGLLQFALAIVPTSLVAISLHFATFAPKHLQPWQWILVAAGNFLGFLWVVAFSEDVFRSVITRMLLNFGQARAVAAAGSAVLFGCAHLWYHAFPNWRFAAVAAVGHLFYTIAYLRSGSVRASMVTHALTVTTWRMFFHS